MSKSPKILLLDIETSLLEAYVFGIRKQYLGVPDIKEDWSVMSWAAKWHGKKRVYQEDNRKSKNVRDDKALLKGIWNLLNEADLVVTQNGEAFDSKKLNARFIINGLGKPASYQHCDVYKHAKKLFGFTSHKLEYISDALQLKSKKLKHNKYPGKELWKECLKGNQDAWKAMAEYNKFDILALEDYYEKIRPWIPDFNFKSYNYGDLVCSCGSRSFMRNGARPSRGGMYQRLNCRDCGAEHRGERIK